MYKSKLQELCHRRKWQLPEYAASKVGQDHNPRFQATVTINGISFNSQSLFKSSKEAQNDAAKLALDHFSQSSVSVPSSPYSPAEKPGEKEIAIDTVACISMGNDSVFNAPSALRSRTGSSSASIELNGNVSTGGTLQMEVQETDQIPHGNEVATVAKHDDIFIDMHHLYKNQLQTYVQKRNLTLPVYSCECDGAPHARRFKCKVTVGGHVYESQEFFGTVNESEHAAAKIALTSLLPNGVEEASLDESAYKNLLQELAQKEGYCLPAYSTIRSGEPHNPIFASTVEVGGEVFTGREGRTKKQAEMSVAKIAYTALKWRNRSQNPTGLSPSFEGQALKFSPSSLQSDLTAYLQQNVQPKLPVASAQAEERVIAEAGRCHASITAGSNSDTKKVSTSSGSSVPSFRNQGLSSSLPSDPSTDLAISASIERLIEMSSLKQNKIVIHPRQTNMSYPSGSTVLDISDDNWVAVKIPPQSSH